MLRISNLEANTEVLKEAHCFCSSWKHWIVASTIVPFSMLTDTETYKNVCNLFNLAKFTCECSIERMIVYYLPLLLAFGINPLQVQFQ